MSVWPVVMLKVAEPVLKSHMINVPPRSADSNMPATFITCTGGVGGRYGGRCGRAVWRDVWVGGVECTAPLRVHHVGCMATGRMARGRMDRGGTRCLDG